MAHYREYSLLVYQKNRSIEKHFLILNRIFLKTSYSNGIIVKRVIFCYQSPRFLRHSHLKKAKNIILLNDKETIFAANGGAGPMDVFADFLNSCLNQQYWQKNSRILLAVSGGVDSMVLLDMVRRLPENIRPWFSVLHVNHQLRAASDKEEQYVKKMCQIAGIPFSSTKWSKEHHPVSNTEEAARNFRYAFFKEQMRKQHATHLVTAHHGDDQAETILMRLVRGSSLESITGIKPIRSFASGKLVRPLLPYTKADLYAYGQQHQVQYFEDETNQSLVHTRNRYRNQVLPLLKEENVRLVDQFTQFASDLEDVLLVAQAESRRLLKHLTYQNTDGEWVLDRRSFAQMDASRQRLVIEELLQQVYSKETTPFQRNHIQAIQELALGTKPNSQLNLAGKWHVRRVYDRMFFSTRDKKAPLVLAPQELQLSQWLELPQGGRIGLFQEEKLPPVNAKVFWLNAEKTHLPLTVRQRQPGDRMRLKGKGGTKKIKRILIDQKVPREQRDELRVVCDNKGEVISFLGYKDSQLSIAPETDTIKYILIHDQNSCENEKGELDFMQNTIEKILVSREDLEKRTQELGAELSEIYQDKNPLVVGILKGAVPFLTDLTKAMDIFLEMDFMDVSSYGNATVSSGEVKILKDLDTNVEGRNVLIVEDIIDSGRTLSYIIDMLKFRKAKSIKIVTLLDKPEGRVVSLEADYVGFDVPNEFVVGYGLDYRQQYRNLPYIGVLKPEIYK